MERTGRSRTQPVSRLFGIFVLPGSAERSTESRAGRALPYLVKKSMTLLGHRSRSASVVLDDGWNTPVPKRGGRLGE